MTRTAGLLFNILSIPSLGRPKVSTPPPTPNLADAIGEAIPAAVDEGAAKTLAISNDNNIYEKKTTRSELLFHLQCRCIVSYSQSGTAVCDVTDHPVFIDVCIMYVYSWQCVQRDYGV